LHETFNSVDISVAYYSAYDMSAMIPATDYCI